MNSAPNKVACHLFLFATGMPATRRIRASVSILARPFRAGATRRGWRCEQARQVSILARPFERALRCARPRCARSGCCFNPRPPFRAGATRLLRRCWVCRLLFQSSPALSSGRYGGSVRPKKVKSPFQSSPALSSGRYGTAIANGTSASVFQSSPALSSGRYNSREGLGACGSCFNPRPPFRAGATRDGRRHGLHLHVSILARPFERALRSECLFTVGLLSFQSSPALSSGRYGIMP